MSKNVGKYELGKTLYTGSVSRVKMAVHLETHEPCALKMIDTGELVKDHGLERRIAGMRLLRHRNIVSVRDAFRAEHRLCYSMEPVLGGSLYDKIAQARKFDEATARSYFQQLVWGLQHGHRHGIPHRDLRPEKLLLGDEGQLKITNFGLGNLQKVRKPDYVCRPRLGPNYVGPEVLKSTPYDEFASDVWSAGVILFVMLAGYLPFDDANINALCNKIERGDYRMGRHFSDDTKDLIGKMLQVDPAKRITLDEVTQHPWFQAPAAGAGTTGSDAPQLADETADAYADLMHQSVPGLLVPMDLVGHCCTFLPLVEMPAFLEVLVKELETLEEAPVLPTEVPAAVKLDAFALIFRLTSTASTNVAAATTANIGKPLCFLLRGGQAEVVAALNSIEGRKPNFKVFEKTGEVKGFINQTTSGLMTFMITLFHTNVPDLCVVNMQKGRGADLDFADLCDSLLSILGDKVRSKSQVQVENCAICKNDISDLCIDCQANQLSSQGNDCQVGWGMCNHAFHHHCISRWIKTRATCPLCDREWELSKLASNAS